MKFFVALGFVCFMGVSVYLILNEKKMMKKPHATALTVKSVRPKHIPPYMLQRERIENISIFTFESNDSGVKYKINEDQLDDFAKQVKTLKESQPAEAK